MAVETRVGAHVCVTKIVLKAPFSSSRLLYREVELLALENPR